jgi:large repetitive protein
MKISRVLALAAGVCLHSSQAFAEGSADLDIGETLWNGSTGNRANDQAIAGATVIRVDIASGGAEKVCWTGAGTLQLKRPDGTTNVGSAIASGSCVNAVSGVTGAYYATVGDQTVGSEWDIRVCGTGVVGNCVGANEQLGRVWSTAWSFQQNTNYTNDYSVNGSVYAVVPGGGVGKDAVIEMRMNGVSGAHYVLRANSTGPIITSSGARYGRSGAMNSIYSVNAEYPLYLSPPASAQYNWTAPVVSNVLLTPACGTGVVLARAAGQISFSSNVTGQYVVVCDVNKDSSYDFAGTADFSSFGAAAVGANTISWDGRDNAGASAAEGSYNCIVRLNVGEFHYVAEDIETSYPGIRMYRIESNKTTRSPIRMFWDDSGVGAGVNMPNGQASPSSPLALGLDPTASTNAAAPFYFTGGNRAQPNGNARAWGSFVGTGKGNDIYLDQFAAADTAISSAISVSVISNGGDADTDGLTNARECDLGSLPQDNDTDNDGVRDGFEATTSGPSTNTDGDGLLDILDTDDDGDTIPTLNELGPSENGDGNPADAANSDGNGPRDYLDTDSDDDGVPDSADLARTNPLLCRDVDGDGCNDCTVTGANSSGGNVSNDGVDADGDGQCDSPGDFDGDGINDANDLDDDGDGILDTQENTSGIRPDGDADNDGISNLYDADERGDGTPNVCAHTRNPRACDAPPALFDQDGDGKPNHLDLDADGDGLSDASESGHDAPDHDGRVDGAVSANGVADVVEDFLDSGVVKRAIDTDSDQLPDFLDADSDGDGVADSADARPRDDKRCRDSDDDGCDDCTSGKDDVKNDGPDSDGDGVCDASSDRDGDGVPDVTDLDDDGDGILDTDENPRGIDPDADHDGDGIANFQDADDRGDGQPNDCASPRDGRCDAPGALFDQDGDGAPNHLDLDADGDGIFDADESGHDAADREHDGRVDGPVGANGVADSVESAPDSGKVARSADTDGDGTPDFLDLDSDGDRVSDADEAGDDRPSTAAQDSDEDGEPDYRDLDDDGDGLATKDERSKDGEDIDSDGDGRPDYLDLDDDDDGVPTQRERSSDGHDIDTDEDGTPDYLDVDDDGDGIATDAEPEDADDNGVPDRLEPKLRGTLAGGALCSLEAGKSRAPDASALALLLIAGVALLRRKRTQARKKKPHSRATWLGLLSLTLLSVSALSTAHAQIALEQFKPAPLASDGFGLSRPQVLERGQWSTLIWLDYANDPLVYEYDSGAGQDKVVSEHLVGHVGAAVGVAKRLSLFATLPVHLVMKGQKNLSADEPKPEGAGLGDLALGGRLQISGLDPETVFASAFEFVARTPTAELANKDQHYSGDAIGSYEPALIGELRFGRFDIRLRAGARFRQEKQIGNLTLGNEWLGGLGMRVRVFRTIHLHAEVYGSTFMNEAFKRTTTPLEALFGLKHQGTAWVAGVAAGPGLYGGYGSPDVRVVGTFGYAPSKEKPVDTDGDGLLDPQDKCPKEPEDVDQFEDADGCPDLDNDKDGLPDTVDSCIDEPEDTDDFEDTDGCPDRDNDKDGVIDENDSCPDQPEDLDKFEDEDGCVDPDNDRDGILDQADSCPDQPEDLDGFADQDGCPEEGGGKVKLSCDKIEIRESVYFDTGKDTIQARSFELLDQVVSVLTSAKYITQLRIAGHTDDRGNDQKNLALSKRRAASVLHYLSSHGIAPERLSSDGYGETQPIADNTSADGRAQNRRVEFQILEQSGECRPPLK